MGPSPPDRAHISTWSRVFTGGSGAGGGGATLVGVGVGGENSISQNEMFEILCENVWLNLSYFVVLLCIFWIVHALVRL